MKVKFDNQIYNWPPNNLPEINPEVCSEGHNRARSLLKTLFPTQKILEEVPLAGTNLKADFYLPLQNIMIEVQGEQHFNYNPFFHGSKMGFIKGQQNDDLKKQWCKLNNVRLVELPQNESDEQWRDHIIPKSRGETK
jgi:hypothetical protein